MKNVIDGVEITPEIIEMLKDWAPASKLDDCRPTMHVKSLSKVQDLLCRQISLSEQSEINDIIRCLSTLVLIKDDLTEISKIWKGDLS